MSSQERLQNLPFREKLESFIDQHGINREDFCLAGSASLNVRGLREMGDIDIIYPEELASKFELTNLPDYVDAHAKRYHEFSLTNDDVIYNSKYHDNVDGIKIVRPELKFSKCINRMRSKDRMDILLLQEYAYSQPEDWDWGLVYFESVRDTGRSERTKRELLEDFFYSLRRSGVYGTVLRTQAFLNHHTPLPVPDSDTVDRMRQPVQNYRKGRLLQQLGLELHCPIDELLAGQFRDGSFTRFDTILAKMYFDGKLTRNELETMRLDLETDADVASINQDKQLTLIEPNTTVVGRALAEGWRSIPVSVNNEETLKEYNKSWLQSFDGIDWAEVQHEYVQTLHDYGLLFYVIMWPSSRDCWDEIQSRINEDVEIYSKFDILVDDMPSFIRQIYSAQDHEKSWKLEQKINIISKYEQRLRVCLVSPPTRKTATMERNVLTTIKEKIRDEFATEIAEENKYLVFHTTDSYSENREVRDIIESFKTHKINSKLVSK